jgi:hypothetical protein
MVALKSPSPTAPDTPAAFVPTDDGRNTNFSFQNKVFSVEGGYFSMTSDGKEPVFHVLLGDLRATLPLKTLRAEFGIDEESFDGRLLGIIEKSLRYVKTIAPNDSIPRELLDGSASWAVEDRHRVIAESRLAVQVSTWLSGEETVFNDSAQLQQLADDPVTKQRVQNALGEMAERLGFGRDGKQQVIERIDQFARELCYIEALRERSGCVVQIVNFLNRLMKIYRKDKSITEEIVRVLQLFRTPVTEFGATFDLVDAQTGQILSVLQTLDSQIAFVRGMRDDLHFRLMKWDGLFAKWEALEIARSSEAEALVKESYRFVAQHFPQQQSWRK